MNAVFWLYSVNDSRPNTRPFYPSRVNVLMNYCFLAARRSEGVDQDPLDQPCEVLLLPVRAELQYAMHCHGVL